VVGIITGTREELDISLHGVPVVMPTTDREIPSSTPLRYNLQIKIRSMRGSNTCDRIKEPCVHMSCLFSFTDV